MARAGAAPEWISVCRHRVRGFRAPYLLELQHHIVAGQTRIVAPVVPATGDRATLLAPWVRVGGAVFRAMLLDMASADVALLGGTEPSELERADAVTAGLDAIFRGYPAGLPI